MQPSFSDIGWDHRLIFFTDSGWTTQSGCQSKLAVSECDMQSIIDKASPNLLSHLRIKLATD